MKDYSINELNFRFDNGTARVIRDERQIPDENCLAGLDSNIEMCKWIIFGGINRAAEKNKSPKISLSDANDYLEDLNAQEVVKLIRAYVASMSVVIDEGQQVAEGGEEGKKS